MTLLECLDSLNPAHGGTVESAKQRCIALKALGHSVEVVSMDEESAPWANSWPSVVHNIGPGVSRYKLNPRLDSWIRAKAASFDAVIVNGVWRYLGQGVRNGLRSSKI